MPITVQKPVIPPNVGTSSTLASSLGFNSFSPNRQPFGILTNFDSIRDNLRNIIFFRKGDYLDNPDFGVGIQDYIFEQDTSDLQLILSQVIRQQINKYEPRAIVRVLNITTPTWADDSILIDMNLLINNVPFTLNATGSGGFVLAQTQG